MAQAARYRTCTSLLLLIALIGFAPSKASAEPRDPEGLTLLHRAAGRGDLETVTRLVEMGADLYTLDTRMAVSVLHKAVYSGNPSVVSFLVKKGAPLDLQSPSNGDTPLHDAIYFKKKAHGAEVIRILLQSGASLSIRNRAGLTPLESAQLLKDNETVALIKAEMSHRFSPDGIALMKAVKAGNLKAAKLLLSKSSEHLEEADEQGFTPLLWAAREGMTEMTALLLKFGANPNHLDAWMGANAGHKAAFWGRTEVMKLLVAHGLDLNARGLYNGYTPLHDAVSGNHFETAKVLVAAGAKKDIEGHDSKTPLDIARENGNAKLIELLSK